MVSQGIMETPKLECRNQDSHSSIVRLSILGPLDDCTGFLENKDTTITTIGGMRLWQTRLGLCPLKMDYSKRPLGSTAETKPKFLEHVCMFSLLGRVDPSWGQRGSLAPAPQPC